jgi:hypothetical protein
MLDKLISFFSGSGDRKEKMSFYKLYSKLKEWNNTRSLPYDYELPDEITFDSDFWSRVIKLYKATRADGYERAISVFWADGDLILSSVVKGTKKSVRPNNKVKVTYKPSRHKGYYKKIVYLDDKKYSEKDVYHKRVPKKIEVKYLFNMHTHPPHTRVDGGTYYSFFSLQDLKSLIGSNAVITGMISDKLWILIRTNQTPTVLNNFKESEISEKSLEERLNIAVYSGEFKQKLKRYSSPPQGGELQDV